MGIRETGTCSFRLRNVTYSFEKLKHMPSPFSKALGVLGTKGTSARTGGAVVVKFPTLFDSWKQHHLSSGVHSATNRKPEKLPLG